tara:strand:+ start:2971 stop:3198 length:228 start_codon:yes stop_codon:yes gene_type:complete
MSRSPINTIPVENFLQAVKVATKTQQREIKLDSKQYKDLADSISILMARLVELQDKRLQQPQDVNVDVQMDGGNF